MAGVDVTSLIDQSPISRTQIRIFLLCAVVVFLDGVDYQVIGIAAPMLIRDIGFARGQLGWIFSAATLGAAVGGFTCGPIADRLGRQRTLVGTTILFGAGTLATAFAHDLPTLLSVRFMTGLGLGGAVPCFIALTSEYAPRRRRATIVSVLWAAFPLGAMVGGFANAYLVRIVDWRSLFVIWGVVPLAYAAALYVWLPESMHFLLVRGDAGERVRSLLPKITGVALVPGATLLASGERTLDASPRNLFVGGRAAGTIPLWIVLLVVLGTLTTIQVWTPALITPLGFSASDAALVLAFNGLGSLVGTSSAGRLVERFGVARCLVPAFVLSSVVVLLFGWFGTSSFWLLVTAAVLAGVFLGIASSGSIALSALVYPTSVRSTGIGWAMSFGRLGATLGPLAVGLMVGSGASVAQVFLAIASALLIAVPCIGALAIYSRRMPTELAATPSNAMSWLP